ncbi:MAG: spore coat U domain-containing protein [Acidobacteriia bacterium]|nr:spore coat protein U domain-containing protein [Methyloceanibacter sp.]MCL6490274.1 spore coat U domain-containing protein [Terriglobia bacterium]
MKPEPGKCFAAYCVQRACGQNGRAMPHGIYVLMRKAVINPAKRRLKLGGKPSRYLLLFSLLPFAFGLPALPVQAGSSSATFQVGMKIVRNCRITTSGTFNFGNYDPVVANASAPLRVTVPTFISVNCTKNTPSVWVGLNRGRNSKHAPAGSHRAASDGKRNYIGYDFYQDSTFTTLWENTRATAPTLGPFTSAKTAVTVTAYGQAPAGQDVPVGTYTDTITATVNF